MIVQKIYSGEAVKHKLISDLENSIEKFKKGRFILGVCGAPGVGKSTLADWVVTEWNRKHPDTAVLMPMDGYHRSNEELRHLGLLPLKGIPDSFDAESFISKLKAIHELPDSIHRCPKFDRSIEASIEDAIEILTRHKLVVIEGNYLLLDQTPWNQVRLFLDESWFLDSDEELILPRLLSRHADGGKTPEQARKKVESTDLPNAKLVSQSKVNASKILSAAELVCEKAAG